jgi:HAD domain in Swiss Army Knife RNA repair proteins
MAKCDRHNWDTEDKEWCWKCDELTDKERMQNTKKIKVIFLDIDGVLATNKEYVTNRTKFREKYSWAKELRVPYGWNKGCVEVFNEILDVTNADIVISSDWRFHWNLDELDKIFKANGVKKSPIFGTIKNKRKMSSDLEDDRVYQIREWVKFNKPEKWVAIDDMNLSDLGYNFIRTTDSEGLTQKGLKDKIINTLNGDTNKQDS